MQQHLDVTIPSYTQEWANGKQAVFYEIHCQMGSREWQFKRRYREFSDLLKNLKTNHGNLPKMPGKTLFPPKKPEQIEKRKIGLAQFLQSIVSRMDIYSNAAFIEFFQLNDHVPGVKTNQLGMIGRVTHSLMGYRDIILLPEKKLFFSVTSDMSAISR